MYILSWRCDGLMERLNSILNGIYLSKLLNLEFKFAWPDFKEESGHNVIPGAPEDLFFTDFMRAHYLKETQLSIPNGFDINDEMQWRSQVLGCNHSAKRYRNLSERGFDFFFAPLQRPDSVIQEKLFAESVSIFKNAMFTGFVQKSLDIACNLEIEPGISAIHFRCGDVIFGKARCRGRFARSKSLSLPVARHLLDHIDPDSGKILFGASKKDLNLLRGDDGKHVLAGEKLAGIPDGSAGLLAEVMLMSRCSRLFCSGRSGVTKLAKAIGNVDVLDVRTLLTIEEECRVICDFLGDNGCEDLHRAFSAFNAFILSWESGRKENLDNYLEIAGRCDCDNPLYPALRLLVAMVEENPSAFFSARLRLERLWSRQLCHNGFAAIYLCFIKHKKKIGTPVVSELITGIRSQYPEGAGLKRALCLWLERV